MNHKPEGIMAGLFSLFGLNSLIASAAKPSRPKPGKHNRGPYTRNRKSRGMNPHKRKKRELRAIQRRIDNHPRVVYHPHLYLARAIERAPWRHRTPEVYSKAYILADAAPTERARGMFREEFFVTQAFSVHLERVRIDSAPDPRKVLFLDEDDPILHDRDVRHPIPVPMRAA